MRLKANSTTATSHLITATSLLQPLPPQLQLLIRAHMLHGAEFGLRSILLNLMLFPQFAALLLLQELPLHFLFIVPHHRVVDTEFLSIPRHEEVLYQSNNLVYHRVSFHRLS